jgi:hypothetical protein
LVAWPQGSEHNGALRYLDFINYHLNNKTRSGGGGPAIMTRALAVE